MQPHVETTESAASSLHHHASILPNVPRSLLSLLRVKGLPTEPLCRGLGFTVEDLAHPDFRLSYRQTRTLIVRALEATRDPGLGLAAGSRESLVSWGLPGLVMLTFETLCDAMKHCIEHMSDAGSLVDVLRMTVEDGSLTTVLRPRHADEDVEIFLVEELMSSTVSVMRQLIGMGFAPSSIELAFRAPPHGSEYEKFFRCPVRFAADETRLSIELHWLKERLPTFDPLNSQPLRAQLSGLYTPRTSRMDLLETLERRLRSTLDERVLLETLARDFSMSERTLRRRLAEHGVSFRALLDNARRERAEDLLARTETPLADVAEELGFSDIRSFRRAFKRWTGGPPTARGRFVRSARRG